MHCTPSQTLVFPFHADVQSLLKSEKNTPYCNTCNTCAWARYHDTYPRMWCTRIKINAPTSRHIDLVQMSADAENFLGHWKQLRLSGAFEECEESVGFRKNILQCAIMAIIDPYGWCDCHVDTGDHLRWLWLRNLPKDYFLFINMIGQACHTGFVTPWVRVHVHWYFFSFFHGVAVQCFRSKNLFSLIIQFVLVGHMRQDCGAQSDYVYGELKVQFWMWLW